MVVSIDAWMHLVLMAFSALLLSISIRAYTRKPYSRYLFLVFAFLFLALSQGISFLESMFLSGGLILIPDIGLHLSHLFDLLMLVSFGVALTRTSDGELQKIELHKLE